MTVGWVKNYDEALQQAKKQQRMLLLYFHKSPG